MIVSSIYAMRRIWRVYAKRPYFGHDCGGLVKFVGRKQYYVGIRHLYKNCDISSQFLFCQLSSVTSTIPYAIFFPRKPFNHSVFDISICL